jgi:tol-pal system protein YbgF
MRIYALLIGLLLLAGCMPPSQEQLRMEMDLAEMKRRLARLEVEKAESEQSQEAGGDVLQRQVAELAAGLDNLRVEFQSINGRLDDLSQDNRSLRSEMQLINDDLSLQLNAVDERLNALEQQRATAPNRSASAEQLEQPAPEEEPELGPAELYQKALRLIRNDQRFAEGRQLLERFTERYPQHDLYVNALYWTGEALYGEKDYEASILQLQDVISQHANHSKAPAAMLKQALAFAALGDAQNAGTTMQKVVENYPDSVQAETARNYLESH